MNVVVNQILKNCPLLRSLLSRPHAQWKHLPYVAQFLSTYSKTLGKSSSISLQISLLEKKSLYLCFVVLMKEAIE